MGDGCAYFPYRDAYHVTAWPSPILSRWKRRIATGWGPAKVSALHMQASAIAARTTHAQEAAASNWLTRRLHRTVSPTSCAVPGRRRSSAGMGRGTGPLPNGMRHMSGSESITRRETRPAGQGSASVSGGSPAAARSDVTYPDL